MKKFLAGFLFFAASLPVSLHAARGNAGNNNNDNSTGGEPPVIGTLMVSGVGSFSYQTQTEYQLIQMCIEFNKRIKALEKTVTTLSIAQSQATPVVAAAPVDPVKSFAELAKASLLLAQQEFPWLLNPTSPQYLRFVALSTDPAFKSLLTTNPEAPLILAARVAQEYTNHLETRLKNLEVRLADLEARLPK